MNCSSCGSPLSDSAKFCPICGTPVARQAAAQPESQPVPTPPAPVSQSVSPQTAAQPTQEQAQPQFQTQQRPMQQQYQQPNVVVNVQTGPGAGAGNGNYGAAYTANVAAAMGAAPNAGPADANRNVFVYAVLSILTCGIYGYYFIYKMTEDANKICSNDGETTSGLGTFILLSILTCGVYSIYWQYKLQDRLRLNAPRYGVMVPETGATVLAWDLAPIVIFLLFCWVPFLSWIILLACYVGMSIIIKNMNKLASAYNAAHGYLTY